GVAGEICIGGPGVARGYCNHARLTADRFVPDPFSPGSGRRMYRSGDLARWEANGRLKYLGRIDHQVKVRGYRIELGEIEAALLEFPGISQAVVVVSEDKLQRKKLSAYMVALPGVVLDLAELRALVKQRLPEYMAPSDWVVLKELPRTTQGKLDRTALPEAAKMRPKDYVAPETPGQEVVAKVWSEILGVEPVGAVDNFFELGGHSLLAMQVISRIREALRVELTLGELFDAPTVRGLAARVEAKRNVSQEMPIPEMERAARGDVVPWSQAQQRLWFLDQMQPGSVAYNVFVGYRLKGELDHGALEWSFRQIVKRHESLRMRFPSHVVPAIHLASEDSSIAVSVDDLTAFGTDAREREMQRLAAVEIRTPFDLSAGPLLRVRILRLHKREHVLVLVMHHIVT